MYDELVKRLRCLEPWKNCDFDFIRAWMLQAADAIEELSAFKAQITDGRFYVYKLGTLFELKHDPRELVVRFQYPTEPPGVTDINVGNKTCVDCQRDCQMIGLNMPACTAYEPPKEE